MGQIKKPGKGIMDLFALKQKEPQEKNIPVDLKENLEEKHPGLEFSGLLMKPLDFFKENPQNHHFDAFKDENYWISLRENIAFYRTIINPLITQRDGLLLAGHSRLKIAKELNAKGLGFSKLPVRFLESSLSENEILQFMEDENQARFETDRNAKLLYYARRWPEVFADQQAPGRKKKNADATSAIQLKKLAEEMGQDPRIVRKEREIYRKSEELAQEEGLKEVKLPHLELARKLVNERDSKRRKVLSGKVNISSSGNENVATEIVTPLPAENEKSNDTQAIETVVQELKKVLKLTQSYRPLPKPLENTRKTLKSLIQELS